MHALVELKQHIPVFGAVCSLFASFICVDRTTVTPVCLTPSPCRRPGGCRRGNVTPISPVKKQDVVQTQRGRKTAGAVGWVRYIQICCSDKRAHPSSTRCEGNGWFWASVTPTEAKPIQQDIVKGAATSTCSKAPNVSVGWSASAGYQQRGKGDGVQRTVANSKLRVSN